MADNSILETVRNVFSGTLGLELTDTDDFFDMGGGSLEAVRVVAIVNESVGVSCPISDLFEHRTVASFAIRVNKRKSELLKAQSEGLGSK